MDIIETNYQRWLNSPNVDEETKKELLAMSEEEKGDAFFKDIEFGTGGMRGLLGPGTNRMNEYTVKRVAIAFGTYLLRKYPDAGERGVALSHDNRHQSREFTLLSAHILNDMGIKCYIFDSLRPTPELSYAVRYSHCVGGVMVTASHNPKEYNGYKVYDDTGCQLTPDVIQPMLDILASLPSETDADVPFAEKEAETVVYDKKIDDEYIALVKTCQENPDLDKKGFKIVYTPQHGASYENAVRVFNECGYEFYPVESQCTHDPDFAGTLSPNPENKEAYSEAIKLANKVGANLILTTDPDGDRCGLGYKGKDGEFHLLTGNQSAALLIDYLLGERKRKGTLSKEGVIYDTIVTSTLGSDIAAYYGVKTESFLTGFKYIGERIGYYEKLGKGPHFEFGYEESYGCLIKPFVRDKDAIQAILLYAEMALFHYLHGDDLGTAYTKLQEKYGFHDARSVSFSFPGVAGAAKMKELTKNLRENPFKDVLGVKVLEVQDYQSGNVYADGKVIRKTGLPEADVIKFLLEDKSTIEVRPSGTEPKIKFYVEAVSKDEAGLKGKYEKMLGYLEDNLGIK